MKINKFNFFIILLTLLLSTLGMAREIELTCQGQFNPQRKDPSGMSAAGMAFMDSIILEESQTKDIAKFKLDGKLYLVRVGSSAKSADFITISLIEKTIKPRPVSNGKSVSSASGFDYNPVVLKKKDSSIAVKVQCELSHSETLPEPEPGPAPNSGTESLPDSKPEANHF